MRNGIEVSKHLTTEAAEGDGAPFERAIGVGRWTRRAGSCEAQPQVDFLYRFLVGLPPGRPET
jgi:hypothetical protein